MIHIAIAVFIGILAAKFFLTYLENRRQAAMIARGMELLHPKTPLVPRV